MSDDMAERLAEGRRLNEARQHGDWTVMWRTVNGQEFPVSIHAYDVDADEDGRAKDYGADVCDIHDTERDEANAAFIAWAANNMDWLLSSVASLQERVRELEAERDARAPLPQEEEYGS